MAQAGRKPRENSLAEDQLIWATGSKKEKAMKTELMRTSLLRLTLLALVCVAAGNAFGQLPDPGVQYHIVARHSGKCLDVASAAAVNGARVVQWDCNEGDNQKWQFTAVGNGDYKIIAKHSGKSLDVFGGIVSQGNGVIVEQWDFNGAGNQLWRLIPVEDGYYRLVAKHSGKTLDINGGPGATANGAQAQQWEYVRGNNQNFRLIAVARPTCASDQIGSTLNQGSAELTANRVSGRPFVQTVNLTVDFTQCRAHVHFANLQPITTAAYDTPVGRNTTTVTLSAGGDGELSATRSLSVQVTLHLTHSLESDPRTAQQGAPNDLTLTLTGPVAANGDVTLTGSGRFAGGYLDGSTGVLRVTGRLSPGP